MRICNQKAGWFDDDKQFVERNEYNGDAPSCGDIQESNGVNFYGTDDIEFAQKSFNYYSMYSYKLKKIAQDYGCLCAKDGRQENAVRDYCSTKGYNGYSQNLLWNDDWRHASNLIQWIKEGPGGGHYENMKNAKEFGCYLADGCNCGWTYTVRCLYCFVY